MNEYLKAVILALVQGLTEFLPVSSSGHLIILGKLGLSQPETQLFFNLMLHLGTLAAVCVVYRKKIFAIIKNPKSDYLLKLIVASVPTVILAAVFRFFLPESLLDGQFLAFGFFTTTLLLVASQLVYSKAQKNPLTYKNSFVVGIVQGIAVLPGISRSGSTISTAMFFGVDREESADFSFLLSIPIIIGSAAVETFEVVKTSAPIDWGVTAVGVIVSFISGFVAIKLLLKIIKKHSFIPFAIYTAAVALFVIFYF